jgi:hypothetical protein
MDQIKLHWATVSDSVERYVTMQNVGSWRRRSETYAEVAADIAASIIVTVGVCATTGIGSNIKARIR